MLDSLIRYEFLKVRSVDIRSSLANCEIKYAGQSVELAKSRQAEATARQSWETARVKKRKARLENWIWRGATLLYILKLADVW